MNLRAAILVGCPDDFPPEHWYLSDDFNMPVTVDNHRRENILEQTFQVRVAAKGRDASILANVALRWDVFHPGVGVDPDLMWVEPRLPPGRRSVRTWEPGSSPPRVAVEVVSHETASKDYRHGPAKYAASGTRELWVFDPDGYGRTDAGEGPWTLQVWRRAKSEFRRVHAGAGPAFSRELGAWLVVVDDVLRVANDRAGDDLWPTHEEITDRERARASDERRAREDAETRASDERRAREDAETRASEAETRASDERRAREDAEARLRALEARLATPPKARPRSR